MMSKFMEWVDARFPATKMWNDHLATVSYTHLTLPTKRIV